MNRTDALLTLPALASLLAAALFLGAAQSGSAQNVQHLTITQPGGMPGQPLVTGIQPGSNSVTVTWDGPSGYYQLFEQQPIGAPWKALGGPTNLARRATVPALYSNAIFRVGGPAPHYAGAKTCSACHSGIHQTELLTPHFAAFTNAIFKAAGGQTNTACFPCHTVGYGLPTGFVSLAATPQLAGVQCENCHGPAANHAANEQDPTVRPRVELAATVCGGCHSGVQNPTYNEWTVSGHAAVTPVVVAAMNRATNSIDSCGRCHSGSARVSLLKHEALPVGDADVAIVCGVCHDPHSLHAFTNVLNGVIAFTNSLDVPGRGIIITNSELGHAYTNQLRNPLGSTNDYFVTTNGLFTSQYNSNINLCAQCHNHRGASWTDWTQPPHPSPQYNMLLGTIGELDNGPTPGLPAAHSRLEKQCATCHMPTAASLNAGPGAYTGHSFTVISYDACIPCHASSSQANQAGAQLFQSIVSNQVLQVKADLDTWATNAAPAALAGYGKLAWEYTRAGDLSGGGAGPTNAALQALIPMNIQKARFNLYLVHGDGSSGIHNILYSTALLNTADAWVQAEINQPPNPQ